MKCKKCDGTGFTPWVKTCLSHPPCNGCTEVRDYCKCSTGKKQYNKVYKKKK